MRYCLWNQIVYICLQYTVVQHIYRNILFSKLLLQYTIAQHNCRSTPLMKITVAVPHSTYLQQECEHIKAEENVTQGTTVSACLQFLYVPQFDHSYSSTFKDTLFTHMN